MTKEIKMFCENKNISQEHINTYEQLIYKHFLYVKKVETDISVDPEIEDYGHLVFLVHTLDGPQGVGKSYEKFNHDVFNKMSRKIYQHLICQFEFVEAGIKYN